MQQLDKRGYMQPRIIDSRSSAVCDTGHVVAGVRCNMRNDRLNKAGADSQTGRPTECRQGAYGCNAYDFSQDTGFRQAYSDENDYDDNYDDETTDDCQVWMGREEYYSMCSNRTRLSFASFTDDYQPVNSRFHSSFPRNREDR